MSINHSIQISMLSILFLLLPENLFSQQKGTIYFVNSAQLKFDSLKDGELKFLSPHNFSSKEGYFSIEDFQEIIFQYEKQPANTDFSYLVKIICFTPENKKCRIRLHTWDWLEIKTESSHKTKMIFFHSRKKYPIHKIVFD